MLIYNTTFHVEMNDARNFVIWLNECYIPEVEQSGELRNPRILRNKPEGEYAIIPAVVAEKIAQRDASSIVLHSALSQDEQDEDDPYADFKVPDDLMW